MNGLPCLPTPLGGVHHRLQIGGEFVEIVSNLFFPVAQLVLVLLNQ